MQSRSRRTQRVDELLQFLVGEAMVVGEALGDFEIRTERGELFLEALRPRDAGDGADVFAVEERQRPPLVGVEILQIERPVRALDDLGGAVVAADALDQRALSGSDRSS